MKNAVTVTALVVVIVVLAMICYREVHPAAPKTKNVVRTAEEAGTILKSGMEYLSQLRQEGRLPGVGTNEHGHAYINGRLNSYPYSLTMQLTKEGETSVYHYAITKVSRNSTWQLKRAWQTDSNGHFIQELSIK